jgi:xanthine dehydrogenase iron-sulfur cluster and FAD-binding subunit A
MARGETPAMPDTGLRMTDAVRFLLNGDERAVEGFEPTTTVLDYLRTIERLCGTKEGCPAHLGRQAAHHRRKSQR